VTSRPRQPASRAVARIVLVIVLCGLTATPVPAQQPPAAGDPGSAAENASSVLESLRRMFSAAEPDTQVEPPTEPGETETRRPPRDPTVPTDRLLQRAPQPQPSASSPRGPRSDQAFLPLPSLPDITLRGLVLRTPDRGTAILDVDGKSITISLVPRDQQQRVPVPASQFGAFLPALQQRAAAARTSPDAATPTDPTEPARQRFEMCLNCSFLSGGVVFNLEAFSRDAVLLKALPHDEVILVRSGTP
jgi:hypothetical protein